MRFVFLLILAAFGARGEWLRNPVAFKERGESITLVADGAGFALRDELPLSRQVTVEGVFEVGEVAPSERWRVAGVAVVESYRNFWHLALVKAPVGQGFEYTFELAEMLDHEWLAQSSLTVEFAERAPGITVMPGSCWHLQLALDEKGVTGIVRGLDGKQVFRQRYAFTERAVNCGQPALHSTGLSGKFTKLKFTSNAAMATAPATVSFPPYQSDSFVRQVQHEARGYFYVQQFPDGRWWAIDPLGRGVVVLGVDHTTFWGHWCEKLGYHPYRRQNETRYPDPAVWEEETLARLKQWGFNMLGAGSQESLRRRGLFHCVNLSIGTELATMAEEYYITPNEQTPCSAFPNVFHPDFEAYCLYIARQQCVPNLNDPWMFGYFIDNELAWWGRGRGESGLFDAAIKLGADHTAKQAVVKLLRERAQGEIARFNALWKTECQSFDDVLQLSALPSANEAQIQVKHDFLKLVAERYFTITTQAIRAADPNHMVLGARFAGTGGADPAVWEITGKYCDVVTFNCYPKADLEQGLVYSGFGADAELIPRHFAKFYGYVSKPMLVTEWSFPALDAGLPSVHGAGQRFLTQTGRTDATKLFAQTMLSLPYLIGYNYFMWVDQPALGISTPFPEDSNYGLVNEENLPYPRITGMFTELHAELWKHRQAAAPAPRREILKVAFTPMQSASKLKKKNPGAADVVLNMDENQFVVDNGRLKLEGRVGSSCLIEKITLDGKLYGSYNAMAHSVNESGANLWRNIQQVTTIKGFLEQGCAVIEISGAFAQASPFQLTHRIIVPPGSSQFVCEVLRIKNIGVHDLDLKGLFCRFDGEGKGWDAVRLAPNVWGMPESGCWIHEPTGAYYGALASFKGSGVKINFWRDQSLHSFHPDVVYHLEKTLRPGETYTPERPVTVIGVLGMGGKEAWLAEVQDGARLLEQSPE
ncbi:MAG: hypothetical protein PHO37_04535 [Kiritimatiellae bacterium]|nr:hypothetical protein [Kiritimatiellia bacterium]